MPRFGVLLQTECGLCLLLGDLARQDLALVAPPASLPVLLWVQASSFTPVWGLSPLPGVPSVPLAGTRTCCPSTALGCVPWGGCWGLVLPAACAPGATRSCFFPPLFPYTCAFPR